jgi:hypothetical protein
MKNPLDTLYAHHQEAQDLYDQTDNLDARNELAHTLTCTKDLIYRLESGEVVLFQEINEVIAHARSRLDAAYKFIEPYSDTERSPDFNRQEND